MNYLSIAKTYEIIFNKYGASPKGIDWPNEKKNKLRYEFFLKIIKPDNFSILDFGCGYAGFLNYIKNKKNKKIKYFGLDINKNCINYCKSKYPNFYFICCDILTNKINLKTDYVLMNGVLTAKYNLSDEKMLKVAEDLIRSCFSICKKELFVNFHSPYITKFKKKLFHPSFEVVAKIAKKNTNKFEIIHGQIPFEQILVLKK